MTGHAALGATAALLLAALFCAAPALAAASTGWRAELDPVAYDASTHDAVMGEGLVEARLDSGTLHITGHFSGLLSNATAAHLEMGAAKGVPGAPVAELNLARQAAGSLAGAVALTPAQRAALDAGGLYVQIDSVKGKDGSLWGWLEPAP